MQDDSARLLEKILQELQEIKSSIRLTQLANRSDISHMLTITFDKPEKRLVYYLTDGTHSAHQIAELTKVSMTSIHRWWSDWIQLGLISKTLADGKACYKALFDLSSYGIETPTLPIEETSNTKIPSRQQLRELLSTSHLSYDKQLLVNIAKDVFDITIDPDSEYGKERLVNEFFISSKMKQLMFLQAIRQQVLSTDNDEFKNYFLFWEKHIKSDL
jgi:hypothetical protein